MGAIASRSRLRDLEYMHQNRSAASSKAAPPTDPTTAPMITGVREADPEVPVPDVALDVPALLDCVPVPVAYVI